MLFLIRILILWMNIAQVDCRAIITVVHKTRIYATAIMCHWIRSIVALQLWQAFLSLNTWVSLLFGQFFIAFETFIRIFILLILQNESIVLLFFYHRFNSLPCNLFIVLLWKHLNRPLLCWLVPRLGFWFLCFGDNILLLPL